MKILEVIGLSKSFGGLMAVWDLEFDLYAGRITALIGPNGAGKTTVLGMISGIIAPDLGSISFNGVNLIGKRPYHISKLGIARTFQIIQLFESMSVLDNVKVGFHGLTKSELFSTGLRLRKCRREEEQVDEKAMEILRFIGLQHRAYVEAGNLSFGEQRLVEIARCLGSSPKLILMDEPASGLNKSEKKTFSDYLNKILRTGITILLVSHDMGLVMNVSHKVIVLNFGRKLSEGGPNEIRKDQRVIDAYLGI